MPATSQFSALGDGNGFPFCADKVDVSGFTNWITLGGFAKGAGSPTEQQINDSLKNAMKLYWNLNSGTASYSASFSRTASGSSSSGSVTETNREVIIIRDGETVGLEPRDRACRGTNLFNPNYLKASFDSDDSSDGSAFGNIDLGDTTFIRRMYDGSTSDESNFVGYGVRNVIDSSSFASTPFGGSESQVSVTVGSYLDGTTANGTLGSGNKYDQAVFQSTLGGMSFRSVTYTEAGGPGGTGGGTYNLSALELSGSASYTDSGTGFSVSSSTSASISDLDFYTYN
jgi:hypothetical protein